MSAFRGIANVAGARSKRLGCSRANSFAAFCTLFSATCGSGYLAAGGKVRLDSHRQRHQSCPDFFQQNRPEVPTVYPDIQALRVAGEIAVAVPVEMQRAVMRVVPDTESVMAKHDRRIFHFDMKKVVDR